MAPIPGVRALIKDPFYDDDDDDYQDFFNHIEEVTEKDLEELATQYQGIGPLLTKMEGLVVNTNTGRSPKMAKYFLYWERKVFDALTKVCG